MSATTPLIPDPKRLLNCPCLVCDTRLEDPTSVTLGIGPTCRKKHGWKDLEALPAGDNARAKALVYEAACVRDTDPDRVLAIASELLTMGLEKLGTRIQDRFIEVRLHLAEGPLYRWDRATRTECEDGTGMLVQVRTPYYRGFGDLLYQSGCRYKRPVYGEDRKFLYWEVKYDEARALYKALSRAFPGKAAIGPKGTFKVPTASEFDSKYNTPRPVAA